MRLRLTVPPWLLILIVMEAVILVINPTRKDFAWFQRLRRPEWLTFHVWIPLIWLTIYSSLYLSALITWEARRDWWLIGSYLVLLVLVEGYTWMMCRSRRLVTGTIVCLLGWLYALVFAIQLSALAPTAVTLLLPYLLWAPVEALATWQMRALNGR